MGCMGSVALQLCGMGNVGERQSEWWKGMAPHWCVVEEMTAEKVRKGGGLWRKPRTEQRKLGFWRRCRMSSRIHEETDWEVGLEEESVRVQKLLLILDEHCLERGDQSIAGGWGRAIDEIFLRFCVEVGRVELKMSNELRNVYTCQSICLFWVLGWVVVTFRCASDLAEWGDRCLMSTLEWRKFVLSGNSVNFKLMSMISKVLSCWSVWVSWTEGLCCCLTLPFLVTTYPII